MGFIAHELQKTYPFLVNGEKDAKDEKDENDALQNVNYTGIISLLVKEIKDLKMKMKCFNEENVKILDDILINKM